jgi:putative tryptophan/tyrosine transport system substrate-binding protein
VPVIGYLASSMLVTPFATAFRRGLSEFGYVEDKNVTIEYQSADGQFDRLPALVADFVHRRVAVLVAPDGLSAALAAKAATDAIPILFIVGSDPVSSGLVASLARPGGNATGLTVLASGLIGKRLELLHRLLPAANSIALLVNPANTNSVAQSQKAEGQISARALGVDLLILEAHRKDEIQTAIANLAK